jgi:POT family proton-dependent oligopeptide transporter
MSTAEEQLAQIQNFKGKYPKQLWYLFLSEMWERFCFYGMRGMLFVFMVSQLAIDEKNANLKYGAIQAFVYAFTFVGGLFADKILGFRKSLFWGGLLMIIGSFIIAVSPAEFFYLGICFNIIGTGFFKPNISTMVGALYKDGDPRRDAGFGLFYSGINFGAFLGGIMMIWLGKNYSWSLAFGSAGVVMCISLAIFAFTQKTMGPIGLSPLKSSLPKSKKKMLEIGTYVGSLLVIPLIIEMVKNTAYTDMFMYIIGPVTLIYLFIEMNKYSKPEKRKLYAALIFIFFSIIFWAFFEQSGGSLSAFALNNLHDKLLGITIDPNVLNNSANSIFVIIFSPIAGILWLWLSKRKIEPNSGVKFGLGFLFLAAAFYLFYATVFGKDETGKTTLDVFTAAYLVMTFGELCLSPIGLSLMTKLSPMKMQGLMMGMWFLASAYGQYVAGLLGANMSVPGENATAMEKLISYTNGYQQLGLYAAIAGIVLLALTPVIKKLMQGEK